MFDIFYIGENTELVNEMPLAKRVDFESQIISNTKMFWLVDHNVKVTNYDIFTLRPEKYDQCYTHIWKRKHSQLDGIKLIPKNSKGNKFIEANACCTKYDVIHVDDPSEYFLKCQWASHVWYIDPEYQIDLDIEWEPLFYDATCINIFKIPGQLEHKYPTEITNVSDNRCGGVKLIPKDYKSANIKYQGFLKEIKDVVFDRFDSIENGQINSTTEWFWVVDPSVIVLDSFKFDYIPEQWDAGKMHTWQIENPISGLVYDYMGVSLYPTSGAIIERPKYMRQPASKQKEYPVYYLAPSDYDQPLHRVYERLSKQTDTDMYWVVDVYTQISPDFAFDYYPTHWDKHNVHVFQNADNSYKSVRLVPTSTFLDKKYSDEAIENNSFKNLKFINTVASTKPVWPVIDLARVEKDEFVNAMKDAKTPFVWTTDSDIKVNQDILAEGFMPSITSLKKVHCWQKINPATGQVNSYGGLRLWPTAEDYSELTAFTLKLNRLRNLQYVKVPGSTIIPYDIILITYNDDGAYKKHDALRERFGNVRLVNQVDGIFEAHKMAAQMANTELFWVIDGDAEVAEDFDFSYIPDTYDKEVVHVWSSKNPVNNLEYGYGGLKLFPTQMVRDASSWGLDFTTGLSTRFKAMPEVSCVTAFNTSEFETWRSAFRECVKLSVSQDPDAHSRLSAWLSPNSDADFVSFAKLGAEQGKAFGIQHKQDIEQLNNINNYNWLEKRFNECRK